MKGILFFSAFLGALLMVTLQAAELLDRPTVYRSVATKQCAFIELADGTRLSCEHKQKNQKYFYGWSE